MSAKEQQTKAVKTGIKRKNQDEPSAPGFGIFDSVDRSLYSPSLLRFCVTTTTAPKRQNLQPNPFLEEKKFIISRPPDPPNRVLFVKISLNNLLLSLLKPLYENLSSTKYVRRDLVRCFFGTPVEDQGKYWELVSASGPKQLSGTEITCSRGERGRIELHGMFGEILERFLVGHLLQRGVVRANINRKCGFRIVFDSPKSKGKVRAAGFVYILRKRYPVAGSPEGDTDTESSSDDEKRSAGRQKRLKGPAKQKESEGESSGTDTEAEAEAEEDNTDEEDEADDDDGDADENDDDDDDDDDDDGEGEDDESDDSDN